MKLYLSSFRIPVPEELFALLPVAPKSCRLAVVTNAGDNDPRGAGYRAERIQELTNYLNELGFSVELVSLRDFDSPVALKAKLLELDMLFVAGGNTFMLRDAMHKSGFDNVVRDVLDSGVVYVGESAGAIVMGKTLRGFENADTPDLVDEVMWDGLGFYDGVIAPHADSPKYQEEIADIVRHHADTYDCVVLNDNQALVINGSTLKVVTS